MPTNEFAFDDLELLMDRTNVDLYVVGQTAIGLLDEFSIRLGLVGEIILRALEVLSKIFVPPWACYKMLDRIGEEADLIAHACECKNRIRHANLMERYGVHCGYDGIRKSPAGPSRRVMRSRPVALHPDESVVLFGKPRFFSAISDRRNANV